MKILILGGSGMLGSMVTDYLSKFDQFKITSTVRNRKAIDIGLTNIHNVNWVNIDVNNNDDAFERIIEGNNWIIQSIRCSAF